MTEATAEMLREEVHAAELREAAARDEYVRRVEYTVRMRLALAAAERREAAK